VTGRTARRAGAGNVTLPRLAAHAPFVRRRPLRQIPRVLHAPCLIVSDAHIGVAPADAERSLLAFLRHARTSAGSVVVNGDLFEFWFEWRSVIPRQGYRILAALADLADASIPVLWVAGNHDGWGGEVLRRDVGVTYHVGPWRGTIAGWRALVDHGDGLRQVEDRKYRAMRSVIRHRLPVWAFRHLLHPDWASRLANGTSHASRTYVPRDGGRGLHDVAMGMLAADPAIELLVFGHSHVPGLDRSRTGSVYANAGAWLSAPTYLRVDEREVSLRRWTGSAEGDRLHVLDRLTEKALPEP
jgi:UDP-2,3-diacylglucosamine hydrolase